MTEYVTIYATFPDKAAALSTSHALVERKLITCANIIDGMTSVYLWEGNVEQSNEVVLIAKTTASKAEDAYINIEVHIEKFDLALGLFKEQS